MHTSSFSLLERLRQPRDREADRQRRAEQGTALDRRKEKIVARFAHQTLFIQAGAHL